MCVLLIYRRNYCLWLVPCSIDTINKHEFLFSPMNFSTRVAYSRVEMDCIKIEVDSENYVFVRFSVGSGFWIGMSGPEVFLSIIQLLTAVFTTHPFEKYLFLVK